MAVLRSNDGNYELAFEFSKIANNANSRVIKTTLRIQGTHWDGDHTHEISLMIEALWIISEKLVETRDCIRSWVDQPLNQLVNSNLKNELELTELPGQSLTLRFGSRPEIISGINPVVTVTYRAGPLSGEYIFVTDQSCLGNFAEEISCQLALST
jgi:hypothetical protein